MSSKVGKSRIESKGGGRWSPYPRCFIDGGGGGGHPPPLFNRRRGGRWSPYPPCFIEGGGGGGHPPPLFNRRRGGGGHLPPPLFSRRRGGEVLTLPPSILFGQNWGNYHELSNRQRLKPFQLAVINSDLLGLFQHLAQLAQGHNRQFRRK